LRAFRTHPIAFVAGLLRVTLIAAAIALVATAVGCGGSRAAAPVPLIVDTDLSSDDLIALAAVARDPGIRLQAVTVSGTGLVECPGGARLASSLLSALGERDVPVACGRTLPLSLLHVLPADWRTAADHMFGVDLPPGATPTRSAVSLLQRTIEKANRPPTVLELAPMTNLAELLRRRPGLADEIREIVAMGGTIAVPGNAPEDKAAETNIWLDPAAAKIVLESGVRLTLVPLDATNDVPVTASVAQTLERYHFEAPAATIVWDLISGTAMDRGGQYFWDPLAALAVTHRELVRTSPMRLAVSTRGIASGRTVRAVEGTSVRVATHADRAAFERVLLDTLLDGHAYTAAPQRADATVTYTGGTCSYSGVHSVVTGQLTVDTINRSSRPFTWVAGRLAAGHTFAELVRYVLDPRHSGASPRWFAFDASGETPPHSTMTWRPYFPTGTTGTTIVGCGTASPPQAWLLARVAVFGNAP
jgi:inosine-uridine nucleoside N-ribohydrolase